jgi:hypothetical protein
VPRGLYKGRQAPAARLGREERKPAAAGGR